MIESRNDRKVVVTGVGVVAPCGTGADEFWAGLAAPPEPAVVRRVADFDPARWGLSRVESRRLDRFAQFGVAAAARRLVDAGLLPEVTATGSLAAARPRPGGHVDRQRHGRRPDVGAAGGPAARPGERSVSPLTVPMVMPNAAAAAVSMRWDLRGPSEPSPPPAPPAPMRSPGRRGRRRRPGRRGARRRRRGRADRDQHRRVHEPAGVVVDRGVAPVRPGAGRLLRRRGRGGAGSGGGRARGGASGAGLRPDRGHRVERRRPPPHRTGAGRAWRADVHARRAGRRPAVAGRRDPRQRARDLDRSERRDRGAGDPGALSLPGPAVSAIKGVIGHAQGAAGALEAAAVALAYARRILPPTMGTAKVDPAFKIDVVLEPRHASRRRRSRILSASEGTTAGSCSRPPTGDRRGQVDRSAVAITGSQRGRVLSTGSTAVHKPRVRPWSTTSARSRLSGESTHLSEQ